MRKEERLLKPTDIPSSLWDSDNGYLILPSVLANAYEKVIDRHGLRALAMTRDIASPPVGGLDKDRSDKHFAQAFDGSCARAQLAMLDPKNELPNASNAFISCLAGNGVTITDAPCGAGAAALNYLTTIAELRAQKVLPRTLMEVHLIGAELSQYARYYAHELLEYILPSLEMQAIFVNVDWLEWDVTNKMSNTSLITKMSRAAVRKSNKLLVVANFNGFLEMENKKKIAAPQLEELFRHASIENSMAIWIEPNMNSAKKGLFPWLRSLLEGAWRIFASEYTKDGDSNTLAESSARFRVPLIPDKTARVGLSLIVIELGRVK